MEKIAAMDDRLFTIGFLLKQEVTVNYECIFLKD